MNENVWPLILLGGGLLAFLLVVSFLSKNYSLNNFKSKTVGDGQHGTARWATPREISKTYRTVPFRPRRWRKGEDLPTEQGLVLGSVGGRNHKSERGFLLKTSRKLLEKLRRPVEGKRKTKKKSKALSKVKKMIEEQRDIRALVDSDDVHCLMIGASGVGKTAFFLYPNLEYACACGMSYLALDTKGDLARNYGCIASKYYGYQVTVIDLRNPTCSDGFNFMTLVNHYMDRAKRDPNDLTAKAKAENYAKILAKTIISPEGSSQYGDNAFFYESAEGVLAAIVMLLAEFILPEKDGTEKRHIVSAFKLVQDLLAAPGGGRGKNGFHVLMDMLPSVHKARWVAGAALTAADQAMASVMSTVLSKLNAFLDSELEQVICRDIIMLAPIFSGEYEGVDNIILTSKYGKTKCATAKVAAGILTAILTTALVAAFNLLLALIFYGTEGLDCSILFAPSDYAEGFIPFNITCGTLLKYQILLAFTCTLSVTGITLLISAISKNQIVAFVASMAIFLFPVLLPITEANPLFRLIGLLPLYHVQAVSLLSVEQMSNGMLYAVWAIPTALLFLGIGAVISRRVFAKHQVS